MSDAPLRVTEAARRLGVSTKEVLALVQQREIGFVMQDGIAHIPTHAFEEYRTRMS